MQVTIGGMSSGAATGGEVLFGELDVCTGVLLIDAAKPLRAGVNEQRVNGCAVATNNPRSPDYDALFQDADIRDAIDDYFTFSGRGLLVLDDAVARYNPALKIEADGIDERGRRHRIAPDMSDGQMAVIVMCWFAARQAGFSRQLEAFDELGDMGILTVGLERPGSRRTVSAGGSLIPVGPDGWPL